MFESPLQSPGEVELISVEQARAMVDDLIAKDKLLVDFVDKDVPVNEKLGSITRGFFSRYASICTRSGSFRLGVDEVSDSEYVHGYLSIGHSEDWDVVQRPGNDEVFVVEGAETSEAEMEVRFASVYHLILNEIELAKHK